MKVLAIDTTTAACSAAVYEDGDVTGYRSEIIGRGHAELLMPMIETVMAEAGTGFDTMDGFAVTRGPGSFTGVRVGLATARGLALASARPLFGMTTLAALAASVPPREVGDQIVVAAIDARRDQVYVEPFTSQGRSLLPAVALSANAVPAWLASGLGSGRLEQGLVLVGTGASEVGLAMADARLSFGLTSGAPYPDAAVVARCAAAEFERGVSSEPVTPCYLRGSGAGPTSAPSAGA
ncbi:MAG: tRNA (adenosine(37)-N6)-threonylcarbamoyltransferase complex dimerization subunit type 1 TsaB [Rhodospirillaceae bacterium]|jgi:tRNA threonylcarbamoyladenosine biosynthesis protein TsaB|nr:tRNA (adenosine(37)-N6)-threonylcarbamoyltransferase complex dimerization subunit type 1 TsaB [Rhodospirillaceae bacterium]